MLNWFLSRKKQTQKLEAMSKKYLIVGLGNIGPDYINTRHNIGFKVLNHFANTHSIEFETRKLGALANYKFKGRTFLLLKPNTFMNLSGKAVKYWLEKEKIPFLWVCDNPKKIGKNIYGQHLKDWKILSEMYNTQSIITVANENAQQTIRAYFKQQQNPMLDYFFFC